ncbi:SCO4225 family membrane protein [Streptomyces sp. NBC_00568]|uniref:SCO4225 family membrane protein n=1 Tax=Streptomyces sp. NBC_00568 TaxID=2975779 RepID=UPI002254E68F|nr:hypothetical protein [Streptomyces sp. NBC_00568]MCX4993599.1 hypothetical protein [Streptomyces sp. NBC_00568]
MTTNTVHHRSNVLETMIGNWVSRAYLAVCAVVLLWAVIDHTVLSHADASFAAVYPLLLTAPAGLVVLALPESMAFTYPAAAVLGAFVNAWLLGTALRAIPGLRRG